jgi:hypothetical protein
MCQNSIARPKSSTRHIFIAVNHPHFEAKKLTLHFIYFVAVIEWKQGQSPKACSSLPSKAVPLPNSLTYQKGHFIGQELSNHVMSFGVKQKKE